jgi:NAD(P)-dependent dehydrogenase (short-subunit alcohol dehydrogenase family)
MRWTLVTGGAVSLGAEITRMFAKQKRNCVIHYRHSKNQAEQLQKELQSFDIKVETIQGDFSTLESTQAFLQQYLNRFSETEILINNVGNYFLGPATMTSPKAVSELFQVNVNAALMCIQALLPSLKKYRGHVVNIGMAGSALNIANTYATIYNMTKLSLSMLTKSLAKELAPFQINVNMVSPGYLENSIDFPKSNNQMPWGRPATLSEVAEVIHFLTSGTARYMTGQNLEVAGGTKI